MSRLLPGLRWPWVKASAQPDAPDELNAPDAEHTVRVVTRRDLTGEAEVVWATPEAADSWNERVWRDQP